MNYKIRSYKKGEEKYVADLHKRLYSQEYHWGKSFTDYAEKIALDFAKKERNEREELFVAEADGKLAGCIMLCQGDDEKTGQLRLFAVEKDFRRYGIGSALTDAFMEKAKSAGYKKLVLWTASPLTAAIHHYEKLGFKITKSVPNHTWTTDGTQVDEIEMEKEI